MEECYEKVAGIIVMDNTIFQTISMPIVTGYSVGSVIDFCEKFKGGSMVFVICLLVLVTGISDPYMFRLLVMGRWSNGALVDWKIQTLILWVLKVSVSIVLVPILAIFLGVSLDKSKTFVLFDLIWYQNAKR